MRPSWLPFNRNRSLSPEPEEAVILEYAYTDVEHRVDMVLDHDHTILNDLEASSIISNFSEYSLAYLRETYFILHSITLRAPTPADRACHRRGGEMCMFEDILASGFRFPIHPFVTAIMKSFGVVPTQISPNG